LKSYFTCENRQDLTPLKIFYLHKDKQNFTDKFSPPMKHRKNNVFSSSQKNKEFIGIISMCGLQGKWSFPPECSHAIHKDSASIYMNSIYVEKYILFIIL